MRKLSCTAKRQPRTPAGQRRLQKLAWPKRADDESYSCTISTGPLRETHLIGNEAAELATELLISLERTIKKLIERGDRYIIAGRSGGRNLRCSWRSRARARARGGCLQSGRTRKLSDGLL